MQNKIDINEKTNKTKTHFVSAKENKGVSKLFTGLSTQIKKITSDFKLNNLYLINSRQKTLLSSCLVELKRAVVAAKKTKDLVVFVSCLRACYADLNSLRGDPDKEKIINNIFKDFCVGK